MPARVAERQPTPPSQAKEYKTLISEANFTKETLRNLLANNELGHYDPMLESGVFPGHWVPDGSTSAPVRVPSRS